MKLNYLRLKKSTLLCFFATVFELKETLIPSLITGATLRYLVLRVEESESEFLHNRKQLELVKTVGTNNLAITVAENVCYLTCWIILIIACIILHRK